jgi:hypothetical protein
VKWRPGPPPPDSYGVYLVILDEKAVRARFAASGVEYTGEPVAVHWWGHKGKDTLRQTRVDADLVLEHFAIPERK